MRAGCCQSDGVGSLKSCQTMKEAYAVRRTVPPSEEIQASIDKLLSRGMVDDPQKMLSELAKDPVCCGKRDARLCPRSAAKLTLASRASIRVVIGDVQASGAAGAAVTFASTCRVGPPRPPVSPKLAACRGLPARLRGARMDRSCVVLLVGASCGGGRVGGADGEPDARRGASCDQHRAVLRSRLCVRGHAAVSSSVGSSDGYRGLADGAAVGDGLAGVDVHDLGDQLA